MDTRRPEKAFWMRSFILESERCRLIRKKMAQVILSRSPRRFMPIEISGLQDPHF
jgi:hypothetical protein